MEHAGEILRYSLDCVHCGLCLSSCPTYRATGCEQSSPRGRIYLFRNASEGRLALEAVAEEAGLCLGCRACETACPSGVQFGRMLELVRADVAAAGLRRDLPARLERFMLRSVVARPRRLRALFDALRAFQGVRLDRLLRRLLPERFEELFSLLPPVPPRRQRRALPERISAKGSRRGTVGLFTGCVMSEFYADVNASTARVLTRNGFDVVVPQGQGCCGALHAHAGDETFAGRLGRANAGVFGDVAAVIVNSAGCGAELRELPNRIGAEGDDLAGRIRDVCEFLDEVGLREPLGRLDARVCYDDPCHLVHGQRVSEAPRRLLQQIPGLTLLEHAEASACCGAAGTYNLTKPRMSGVVRDRKLDALEAAAPDVIATGNPGCLIQLRAGVLSRGLPARVVHPVTLLEEAGADPDP
ncbi:MAG: heterodisulfide reductase-related iron-sulfur binding cluster [Myxococcota bacterium]|jgi:glycolate oxidase iron-sulfur subunit|nr:hypothetical protein [Deltaproteobacteria bacterium]MCP4245268.1 4Fe-4S dicluster domain-containing protein [bacterium]MDP6073970.1 heterodisulfide reductase-related iron-sulfur binding cluster [Myxococcota bacterium]MBT39944.1 hypothetical protein [Deltaproteobacteria bacterium]MDP6241845.1 heterodisulfide reductase-related iron-sulfur binding cluster [Myxococcota bacterium]